ncbi:MAG: cytochrome c biogenesis protein CcsA [Planctomycetaceae bacterium]
MRTFGEICLLLAFVGSGYGACACLLTGRAASLTRSGVWSIIAAWCALTGTLVVLSAALIARDFQFDYVAQYTSRTLPWQFALAALWVGQAGSLLLWAWLTGSAALVFLAATGAGSRYRLPAFGLLAAQLCLLIAIMVFAADPMKVSLSSRADGLGLSPLLQHPSMLIHPPIVILSYALWSVPAAVAASALTTGELELAWTLIARPWALCAWLVLGTGLLLGADWAYQELGWGGYWGWDPVENGSLIPWLTGTALVHSLMAWRHRGVLKKSSLALAILTFGLCNFATFLTRSGIFSSVHAFSESPIGWMFLGQMTVLLAGARALVVRRRRQLVAERPVTSLASREAFVHASLFLLLMLTAIVIAGTLWIPVSQLLIGRMVQVGPDFTTTRCSRSAACCSPRPPLSRYCGGAPPLMLNLASGW